MRLLVVIVEKNTKTAKDSVNNYRRARRHMSNKEKDHSEVNKKAVFPKRLDSISSTSFSFERETLLPKNEELELRITISKDQTKQAETVKVFEQAMSFVVIVGKL